MTQIQKKDFDFSKKAIESINKKFQIVNLYSYKKTFFLSISIATFISAGIFTVHNVNSYFDTKRQNENIEAISSSNLIKKVTDNEFGTIIKHMQLNKDIYDEKIVFLQEIIVKAEVKDYKNTISAKAAAELGKELENYKEKINSDINQLYLIQNNAKNDIKIDKKDLELFIKYQHLSKTKTILHSTELNNLMNDFIYTKSKGNNTYNVENNIYETLKLLDKNITNTFNNVESAKTATIKP